MTDRNAGEDSGRQVAQALWRLANGETLDEPSVDALRRHAESDPSVGPALQVEVIDLWRQRGESVGGWKIAWTSRKARDSGGPGYRPFGYILQSRIFPSGHRLTADAAPSLALEPEICVVLGTALGGSDVTPEQARAAVVEVRPAFEICSKRAPAGLSHASRIGNAMNNWGLLVGPGPSPDLALDTLTVSVRHNGELARVGGSGPDVLDDPFQSLARVCVVLDSVGLRLEAGQRLITGSILPSTRIEPDSTYEADFGPLGRVTAVIDADPT